MIPKSETFRETLQECLGGPWPEPCDLAPEVLDIIEKPEYRLEKVRYQVEEGDFVSAWVLIPAGLEDGHKAPAICVWHNHGNTFPVGKSEPAGIVGKEMHFTGVALAKMGYVVICPDSLCFEERQDPTRILQGTDYERYIAMRYMVEGKSLPWKNILDMRRCIDYLVTRPEVDADHIGCYGNSLGSTFNAILAPFEDRVRCFAGNCCLPSYEGIHRAHILHSYSNFIPGILPHGDIHDIAAFAAPRPMHLNFGALDPINPLPEVKESVAHLEKVYEAEGASNNFTWFIEDDAGHVLSDAMWKHIKTFFEKHLPVTQAESMVA